MKKIKVACSFTAGVVACFIFICIQGFDEDKTPKQVAKRIDNGMYFLPAPSTPHSLSFAGEPVPMDRRDVKEQFERELLINYYMPGNILYMLKLSTRYFPLIEKELKANNVPDDFKYLCVAESNLQNAVSRVGASGFWQFMKGTAPAYGLDINATVDERYHVQKSTRAACDYLKRAYQKFGNWTAAAASYNCGIGGYADRSNFQGSGNYYDLVLPEETQRYIFRILVFKYLLNNADSLGFVVPDLGYYAPEKTRSVRVTGSIPNLASFARENGSNYKILKQMNPWLRGRSLTVAPGKNYTILLPAE